MRVLIAGGGPAALEALIGLRRLVGPALEAELLSSSPDFVHRPSSVVEPFGGGRARAYPLSEIAADQDAAFSTGTLAAVDGDAHAVRTLEGATHGYDFLLIATGAIPGDGVPGAVTMRGPGGGGEFAAVLRRLDEGDADSAVFAAPAPLAWQLPLYELALMTAARLAARGRGDVAIRIVTPEEEPLGLFGNAAGRMVRGLLAESGIELNTNRWPVRFSDGLLEAMPGADGALAADVAVSLPDLSGPGIAGLPHDPDGFIPVDPHGRVPGVEDIYAAGDVTTFPVKQGGLATQQADAVLEMLAARAGVAITPQPFRPVLRGVLLTGAAPRFMRADVAGGAGEGTAGGRPLWWPPGKIAGRYLSPYLGDKTGEHPRDGLVVEVDVDPGPVSPVRRRGLIARAGGATRVLGLEGAAAAPETGDAA